MVSQPDHSRSLSLRGASSVIARTSNSRQRRHGRSHAGGSSYIPTNEFPVFSHTGDVELIITAGGKENRYLLHRLILAQCSGFFDASTSQEWSRPAIASGKEVSRIGEEGVAETSSPSTSNVPTKRRWRYELDPGSGADDIPMLVQKEASGASLFGHSEPPPVRNKPPASNAGFFRSVANLSLQAPPPAVQLSQEDEDLLRDYDNLFRIFYNYSPSLNYVNIADAYIQCKTLLALADMYDALAVVGPRVDHHLLQFQGRLFKQIAKYPPSYLKIGYLARSKVIFTEALIHVVGQWPLGERHLRTTLPDAVLDLIEDKADDLAEAISRTEIKLFRLCLTTSRGERISPSSNYLDWLAQSLFRQWLADNTGPPGASKPHRSQPPPPYSAPQGGSQGAPAAGRPSSSLVSQRAPFPLPAPPPVSYSSTCWRTLGSPAHDAYLGHDECKRFLKLSPDLYSRDNLKRLERRIAELKEMAREVVRPLMACGLQLQGAGDGGSGSYGYLTCVSVGSGDFVWEGPDEGSMRDRS